MLDDVPLSRVYSFIALFLGIAFVILFFHFFIEMDKLIPSENTVEAHDILLSENTRLKEENKKIKEEYALLEKDFFQYNKFREVLAKHDMKYYDRENNNCYQQSQQIQKELLTHGIRSSIFINNDRSHAWLGIWVEATDGSFDVRGNQGPLAEVRDDTLRVVCN